VDPMSDERSWISPYNYCQWNPVGRVYPSGALDGDYFAVDGTYLGSDGYNDKKVYVVDNVPEIQYDQKTLREFKKLYDNGTPCFDPLNPPEVQKLSLNRDELINRARWIYGEGGSATLKGGGNVSDYYAWTIHNKRAGYKSEEAMMRGAMKSNDENGNSQNNYDAFINGTFDHGGNYVPFYKAQQGGFQSLYAIIPEAQTIIASIIKTETGSAPDPTKGAFGWLGSGYPDKVNKKGESYTTSVRVQTNNGYYHYFHQFK